MEIGLYCTECFMSSSTISQPFILMEMQSSVDFQLHELTVQMPGCCRILQVHSGFKKLLFNDVSFTFISLNLSKFQLKCFMFD